MAEIKQVAPSNLLVDAENPRLPQPNKGQREAIRELAQSQGRKLVALARDIVEYGTNPADLPIVMPSQDDLGRHVVLEGNRRLTALKGLESPDALIGALDSGSLAKLRQLAKQYQESPIEEIYCLVVKDRAEAHHWIQLRHTGENDGAGIVRWASDDASRFRARTGATSIDSQALDLLEKHGLLNPEQRRAVPAASFKRVLGTPEVREKAALTLEGGKLLLHASEKRIAKLLNHIANEFASGKKKTRDIYTRAQRIDYANNLPARLIVKPTLKNGRPVGGGTSVKPKANHDHKHKPAKARDHLIPSDCVLVIGEDRIRQIAAELRSLKLEDHTNAISVLVRVFIELSADAYITSRSLTMPRDPKLRNKLLLVTEDLIARSKLTRPQAAPVRHACQKNSFLAPDVTMMNDYVHNTNVFPAPADLRAYWSNFQPFMVAIWSA